MPRRGDKRLAGFHMGLFYRKVPTVNPSVTASPCQLPLAREPRAVPADNAHGSFLLLVTSLTRPGGESPLTISHRAGL